VITVIKMHAVDTWWNEEVNEQFEFMQSVATKPYILVSAFRFLLGIFGILQMPCPVQFLLLVLSVGMVSVFEKTKNVNPTYKAWVAIIFAEVLGNFIWVVSVTILDKHQVPLCMLTCACMLLHQFKFVRSPVWLLVLTGKYVFQWYYFHLILGSVPLPDDILPYTSSILFVLILSKHEVKRRSNSFERFEYLNELESTKKSLSTLLDCFPNGILIIDHYKSLLLYNNGTKDLLNCSSDEEIVKTLSTMTYAPERKIHFQLRQETSFQEDVHECFGLQLNQETNLGIVEHCGQMLQIDAKKVKWESTEALALNIKNVTQIVNLENAVAQNRCKNSMLRSVSHELKTPTYAVISMAEKILKEYSGALDEKLCEKLSILKVSSKLLMYLVNDFLDYTRLQANSFSVNKKEFSIRKSIKDCVKLIEIQAKKKNLEILLRIDENLPEKAFSDSNRFEQILLNLLTNALKNTYRGRIEVCALLSTENKLKLCVSDTGIGISHERIPWLFELFNEAHSRQTNNSACGLGLHISNLLAKELGGPIEVRSTLGKGSSFCYSVDIFREGTVVAQVEECSALVEDEITHPLYLNALCVERKHCYRLPKVLVVDDNDFNRCIITQNLERQGFELIEAKNGEEAVKIIKKEDEKQVPVQLVIMDCEMPVLDGWSASKKVHELYLCGKLNSLPVVVGYSANSGQSEVELSRRSGMVMHLVKPIKANILIDIIRKLL